jgi:hypothetical protein
MRSVTIEPKKDGDELSLIVGIVCDCGKKNEGKIPFLGFPALTFANCPVFCKKCGKAIHIRWEKGRIRIARLRKDELPDPEST